MNLHDGSSSARDGSHGVDVEVLNGALVLVPVLLRAAAAAVTVGLEAVRSVSHGVLSGVHGLDGLGTGTGLDIVVLLRGGGRGRGFAAAAALAVLVPESTAGLNLVIVQGVRGDGDG